MSSRPALHVEESGDTIAVGFVDCKVLNEQSVEVIREDLYGLVTKVGKRQLQLKFNDVEFVCSAFLGTLISLNRKLTDAGGKLIIVNASPNIVEVFELTGLTKLINIEQKKSKSS